ncbi:MAG: AAA family ATPase, partial [Rhodospirillales bacterium]|nr:AAA family ATPase [Rhodospirillales bacterium]
TTRGMRNLRSQFAKTVLVVDESSLASSEQMRGLLRAATGLRLAHVVLVGDEKQLGAVEAGKPFAQLRQTGMQTVVMDEIVRQRDAELKEAVRASLAREVQTAFAKLGGHIAQVDPDALGAHVSARWLDLSPEQRAATGVTAPTRALRDEINETIRTRLVAEGAVAGPARQGEKLVSRGLTRAEMTVPSN